MVGIPDEERLNGFGVSACAVCDGFFYKGQEVVVVVLVIQQLKKLHI